MWQKTPFFRTNHRTHEIFRTPYLCLPHCRCYNNQSPLLIRQFSSTASSWFLGFRTRLWIGKKWFEKNSKRAKENESRRAFLLNFDGSSGSWGKHFPFFGKFFQRSLLFVPKYSKVCIIRTEWASEWQTGAVIYDVSERIPIIGLDAAVG